VCVFILKIGFPKIKIYLIPGKKKIYIISLIIKYQTNINTNFINYRVRTKIKSIILQISFSF
jgi:hypothetical protein